MIIDIHCHIENYSKGSLKYPMEPYKSIKDVIETYNNAGINKAVITSLEAIFRKDEEGLIEGNAYVYKLVKEYPEKFMGACVINAKFKKTSLKIIERYIGEGFVMIGEICQYIQGYKTYDEILFPLIEKSISLQVPIQVHTSSPEHSQGLGELSDKYPEGKFIMSHAGGSRCFREGLEVAKKHNNIYIDLSGGGFMIAGFVEMCTAVLGAERLTFGTDFPVDSPYSFVTRLENAFLTDDEKKQISSKTLLNLLKHD